MAENDKLASRLFRLIGQCESYLELQRPDRAKALDHYNGEVPELEPREGEVSATLSKAVSKDVRSTIRKLMPSVMRTIMANDKVVEYQPVAPGTEDSAAQATDYVNNVVVKEADVEKALHAAIFDALTVKTGILTWSAYSRASVTVQEFSGQDQDAMIGLDEEGEIFDEEIAEDGTLSFKLRRRVERTEIKMRAIPRGSFLIHPNATGIADSPLVGEVQSMTRSELVARGYDRETVWALTTDEESPDPDNFERRDEDYSNEAEDVTKAMEPVTIYDVHVLMDLDDDGIAEIHHFILAKGSNDSSGEGAGSHRVILEHNYAAEYPYADVIAEPEAHNFEGHSVAEELSDIQVIKTSMLRQMLDNIAWHNAPQTYVQPDAVMDLDAVYNPQPRRPVLLKQGKSAQEAVQFNTVPFTADKSLGVMQYLDEESRDRTGISDAAGGVDPEALRAMSATGAEMLNSAGLAQAEMIIRSLARGGITKAFRGILRLVVAHADKQRTIRLRGDWVDVDPRAWDADMDCTVNVGLGAGSRERDLSVLMRVLGLQKEVLQAFGPVNNPFVKPVQLYNTLSKIAETAGFPSADPYFTKPDEQQIAQQAQQKSQQPTPDQVKAQTQMQIEQAKAQARSQVEAAQMQADLRVRQVEIDANAQAQAAKIEADRQIAAMRAELEMLKHRDVMALEYEKLNRQAPAFAPMPEAM